MSALNALQAMDTTVPRSCSARGARVASIALPIARRSTGRSTRRSVDRRSWVYWMSRLFLRLSTHDPRNGVPNINRFQWRYLYEFNISYCLHDQSGLMSFSCSCARCCRYQWRHHGSERVPRTRLTARRTYVYMLDKATITKNLMLLMPSLSTFLIGWSMLLTSRHVLPTGLVLAVASQQIDHHGRDKFTTTQSAGIKSCLL